MKLERNGSWLVLLVALFCGCGGEISLVPASPMMSLEGQLIGEAAESRTDGQAEVGLTVAWYPLPASLSGVDFARLSQPAALLNGPVSEVRMPWTYRFDLYEPPPPEALGELVSASGPVRGAMGLLLAYRDLNSNDQLDPIPASRMPLDKVIGSSANLGGRDGYVVVYLEGAGADGSIEWDGASYPEGYSLVDAKGAAPVVATVPIDLMDRPELDFLVCGAPIEDSLKLGARPCGIELPADVSVFGIVDLVERTSALDFSVYLGGSRREDASVRFNGVPLGFDDGSYVLTDPEGSLVLRGAENLLEVSTPDSDVERLRVLVPGDFSLVSPAADSVLDARDPVVVEWLRAAEALRYRVTVLDAAGRTLYQASTVHSSLELPALHYDGPATLVVRATRIASEPHFLSASFGRSRSVHFAGPVTVSDVGAAATVDSAGAMGRLEEKLDSYGR